MLTIFYINITLTQPSPHLFSLHEALLLRVLEDGLDAQVDLEPAAGGEDQIILICPNGRHDVL